ncbi:glycosyltransferase [Geotalea sp. SG265]|uniref:glycosyltransferase n=1 Tax=Geotalea sp. SG265 TaxID=2922867 RepID=UPI001FAF28DC|nr:glycosyltransferase [Geotalea sp. SG265]
MRASVIICTYNRSEFLKQSILSILVQDFTENEFEIVVVDNNSTDCTKQVVDQFIESNANVKYVLEPRQGLSFARNTGIDAARGEIVIFTDDDVLAGKEWLYNMMKVFDNLDVMGAGGPLRPVWLAPRPDWLPDELLEPLTISEFPSAHEIGEFKWPHYPWGANMAFRKDIFAEVGKFATDLGRIGDRLLSNEELELYARIESSGKRIRFAPNAVIYHKVVPERLKKQWFYHRHYWQGRSDAVFDVRKGESTLTKAKHCVGIISKAPNNNFTERCRCRWAKGYIHQLLLANAEPSILQIRILEVIFSQGSLLSNKLKSDLPGAMPCISTQRKSLAWQITRPLRSLSKRLLF